MESSNHQSAPDRSRRIYVWWGVGFAFLGLLGLLCLSVGRPVIEVRRACEELMRAPMAGYFPEKASLEAAVARLGGPEQAARKISLYLRAPKRLAGDYQWTAGSVLGCCGKPGLRRLHELLASDPGQDRFAVGYWGAMSFDWCYRGSPPDWTTGALLETAAKDRDPELAGLAGETAGLLQAQAMPGTVFYRLTPPDLLRAPPK
ncbi:MAG TPA: hypothetical protein PK280_19225 [Planctomycetota bacterium]|nr:hypothetical protein [Planctomycetota bacterium]